MDIWDGAFLPLRKHRDYEHDSFFEHAMADGLILGFRTNEDEEADYIDIVEYDEDDEAALEDARAKARKLLEYWFAKNPVTGLRFENPQLYYALVITLSGKDYDYYIPAPGGGLMPNPELIQDVLTRYIENQDIDRDSIDDFLADN